MKHFENLSKRPNIRPKHLIDCLRDPVHFEFLHRFAKEPIYTHDNVMIRKNPFFINLAYNIRSVKSISILKN